MNGKPSFFAELKRRNVLRMAGLYLVAAWLVVQVGTTLLPVFDAPAWIMKTSVAVLAIGFVPALLFAWVFELTPQGLKRDADVSPLQSIAPQTARRMDRTIIVVLALALLYFGVDKFLLAPQREAVRIAQGAASTSHAARTPVAAAAKSIAVLPFENLSDDKGNAYFAMGMQEMILTKLADIGDLKVISRISAAKYASHPDDLKKVAAELGVATLLEGSVQKVGNEVLINVQLIDVQTDNHLWADAYKRTLDNIFDVEGEVAQNVAKALQARLTSTEARQLAALPTQNPQAYDAYLRGQYYENRALSSYLASDAESAIESYAKAAAKDPRFALAWVRLSDILSFQIAFNGDDVDVPALAARMKTALDHALTLAPDLAETRLAQGWYQYQVQHDLDAALASFGAALHLQPHNANALFGIGVVNKRRGHMQTAIEAYQKSATLDPRNILPLAELALTQMAVHRYAAAGKTTERAIAIDPSAMVPVVNLAEIYRLVGDLDQAEATLAAAPAEVQDNPLFVLERGQLMLYRRRYAAARKLYADLKPGARTSARTIAAQSDIEWYAGNRPQAREHYLQAAALLETALRKSPEAADLHGELGWIYARLGRHRQALEQGALAIQLSPVNKDAWGGMQALASMAAIQAQTGQTGDAIVTLNRLLTMPSGGIISLPVLKLDPTWDPLRLDPRFHALLKEYASESMR